MADPLLCLLSYVSPVCGTCNLIYPGSPVALEATTYAGDAYLDPASLALILKDPRGAVVRWDYGLDPQLERVDVGKYRIAVAPDIGGEWVARWEATPSASTERRFEVEVSRFVM